MLKKVLIIISMLLVTAYLVLAMTHLNTHPEHVKCKKIEVIIKDTSDVDILTKSGIVQVLNNQGIHLVGKRMQDIDTKSLEKIARRFPLVRDVNCYKTMTGKIRIEVTQRIPVLHVIDDRGADYYIDNVGTFLPSVPTYVAFRPIVTGTVSPWFAKNFLYKLGVYLYYNDFWHAAIQQINILPRWEIQLVPRIGNHIIYLGRMDNYDVKLNRLKAFYEKGLNRVGWNKYSCISLEFSNQIICTKRSCEISSNDSIK